MYLVSILGVREAKGVRIDRLVVAESDHGQVSLGALRAEGGAPRGRAPLLLLLGLGEGVLLLRRRERPALFQPHGKVRPGPARVVRLFVWPRHANGMLSTTPLDPVACEMSAQGGNTRRTGHWTPCSSPMGRVG